MPNLLAPKEFHDIRLAGALHFCPPSAVDVTHGADGGSGRVEIEATRPYPFAVVTCASCGHSPPPSAKFCPECGQPLAVRSAALARTPAHLAEKILSVR